LIDAGAHVGLFSLVVSTYAREVISIESYPVNFKLLQINLEINKQCSGNPYKQGVVAEKRTLTLYEGRHSGAHTILKNCGNREFNVSSKFNNFKRYS